MGIELNLNFLFPYFVRSPQAFWRHWHISLSTWLRDYLYVPLGGNRQSRILTYRNLMITMVLGGLWHGAAWPFVIWGVYQGMLLVGYRWASERWDGAPWIAALETPAGRLLGWAVMFHLTCYGWLIFRADSAAAIARMTHGLGVWNGRDTAALGLELLLYAAPLLAVHGWEAWRRDLNAVPSLPLVARYVVYVGLAFMTLLFGEFGGSQFIYFQF
jgi:D-alanyl-lipoteichoic acid acyltransferase DltB (MBOAT superfamily)